MRLVIVILGLTLALGAQAQQTPAQPIVSADALNVLYRGLKNPVSVAVPGVRAEDMKVSCSNTIDFRSQNDSVLNGRFFVMPGKGRECVIGVTSTDAQGNVIVHGKRQFRVKNVPDPKPYYAGKTGGPTPIRLKHLFAAQGVIAKMENFEFDLKFRVVSYKMVFTVDDKPVELSAEGPRVTKEMKEMIRRSLFTQIAVTDIKASGPDGTVRDLTDIILIPQRE